MFGSKKKKFLLGKRFELVKNNKTVQKMEKEAEQIKELIFEVINSKNLSLNLSEEQKEHFKVLEELEVQNLSDMNKLKVQNLISDEDISFISKEIEEIKEIEKLEDQLIALNTKIVEVLNKLNNIFQNLESNYLEIIKLYNLYVKLENEYILVKDKINKAYEQEEIIANQEAKHLKKLASGSESVAENRARIAAAENKEHIKARQKALTQRQVDRAGHATNFAGRLKELCSEVVTVVSNTAKGAGKAMDGAGDGVKGAGEAADGVGKTVQGIGTGILNFFSKK